MVGPGALKPLVGDGKESSQPLVHNHIIFFFFFHVLWCLVCYVSVATAPSLVCIIIIIIIIITTIIIIIYTHARSVVHVHTGNAPRPRPPQSDEKCNFNNNGAVNLLCASKFVNKHKLLSEGFFNSNHLTTTVSQLQYIHLWHSCLALGNRVQQVQ